MALGKVLTSERAEQVKDKLVGETGLRGDQLARLSLALSLRLNGAVHDFEEDDRDGYEINPYTLTRNGRDPWIEVVFSVVYGRDLSAQHETESLMRYVTYHLNQGFYILNDIWESSRGRLCEFYGKIESYIDYVNYEAIEPVDIPALRLLLGPDASDQRELYWELNNTDLYPNSHLAIIGRTGYGKTQLLKWLLYQVCQQSNSRVPCLIFDYKGDLTSDKGFVEALGAEVYDVESRPLPLHVFELDEYTEKRLQKVAAQFQETFSAALSLGTIQQRRLRNGIIQAYKERSNQEQRFPDFEDIFRIIRQQSEGDDEDDSLIELLDRLANFGLFIKRDEELPESPLIRKTSIIDLSKLSAYHELVVYLVLSKVYYDMKAQGDALVIDTYRQMRLIVALDEAHHYLRQKSPVLERLLREGRSFGVSVWLCTQNLSDLVSTHSDYSELVGNTLLFNVGGRVSESDVRRLIGLDKAHSKRLLDRIHSLPPKHCIWRAEPPSTASDYLEIRAKQFYEEVR